ncbi:MAG: 16S rRNA (uracil(1498)-N(3))-methyltransferase [Flavobacteriales bacterium]|nr:16S rRNA (uracil(1498)-N(3))-methyltransferase [Flavobacteriales bacterium]|tara:strand:+ start:1478 stop:2182 length:705 start_codon:yes stop_codon:yes gene_type:complete
MDLFFSKNIKKEKQILSLDESKHCLLSLRKKINDKIWLTEGDGVLYSADICSIKNKKIEYNNLQIISKKINSPKIHIAIAPTKNKSRFEWFLEKATEIGVDEISPLICKNSERKIINETRCVKILIAAMKQAQNSILPKLNKPIVFADFFKKRKKNIYIAHCYDTEKINFKNILFNKKKKKENITILIGPEGDFTTSEIMLSEKMGGTSINLSDNRLRTETAAILASSIAKTIL